MNEYAYRIYIAPVFEVYPYVTQVVRTLRLQQLCYSQRFIKALPIAMSQIVNTL